MIDIEKVLDGSHCQFCETYLGKPVNHLSNCLMCEESIDKKLVDREIIQLRRKQREEQAEQD